MEHKSTADYPVAKHLDGIPWEGHFMDAGDSRIKWVYTPEKDGTPLTVMIIELQAGLSLPEHRHVNQPDLIYPLSGKATMYIEGRGEFPLVPGMVVIVPPNTLHTIRRIEETLTLYNVFAPAMPYKEPFKK